MKIVFVNRFAWPDHSATSQMLSDLAFGLARAGYDIGVVTSRQRYDDPGAELPASETVDGVAIYRIWTSRFGRGRMAGRALDYLTFYLSAAIAVLRIVRRGDVVVVKTDPPLLSVVIGPVARMRGAFVVNWWQDVFPEVATALGVRGFGGMLGTMARALRNGSLRRATMNVAIGERMASAPRSAGGSANPDCDHPQLGGRRCRDAGRFGIESPSRTAGAWPGSSSSATPEISAACTTAMTLIDAADRLRSDSDIVFLFIGGGHQLDAMRRGIESRGLTDRFMFLPYQPREELRESLGVPDVHWLSLRPELEGLVVPSKLYGILAAGRPVIMVGAADGEVGAIVRAAGCGVCVEQGDGAGLAAAIARLRSESGQRMDMGGNARQLLTARFDKAIALQAWRRCLGEAGCGVDP